MNPTFENFYAEACDAKITKFLQGSYWTSLKNLPSLLDLLSISLSLYAFEDFVPNHLYLRERERNFETPMQNWNWPFTLRSKERLLAFGIWHFLLIYLHKKTTSLRNWKFWPLAIVPNYFLSKEPYWEDWLYHLFFVQKSRFNWHWFNIDMYLNEQILCSGTWVHFIWLCISIRISWPMYKSFSPIEISNLLIDPYHSQLILPLKIRSLYIFMSIIS